MIRIIAIALVVTACGSKQPAPAAPAHGDGAMTEGSGSDIAHEHDAAGMQMTPEMKTFHDVLAPRWHAQHGPQRMKDTCDALPQLQADADAIAKATPPRGAHADNWTTGTKQLVAAVGELATTCKTNDAATFEVAFEKVHESFHALMGAAGMHEGKAP